MPDYDSEPENEENDGCKCLPSLLVISANE